MCCFSGKVKRVSETSIFARSGVKGAQYLAYEMTVETAKSVAMILLILGKFGIDRAQLQLFS